MINPSFFMFFFLLSRPFSLVQSPDSTSERSPSLLPRIKRFSEDDSISKAKRKKEEGDGSGVRAQEVEDAQKEVKQMDKQTSTVLNNQSFMKQPQDVKVRDASSGLK